MPSGGRSKSDTSNTRERSPRRSRLLAAAVVVAVLAGALGTTLALALGRPMPSLSSTSQSGYTYYRSMMGRLGAGGSPMMDGGSTWTTGQSGYTWMVGSASLAPEWQQGRPLPGFMMGASTGMGQVMGRLFADAPGQRVSPSAAAVLGARVPTGATADRSADRLTFSGRRIAFTVLASPTMPAENFRVAGLTDPTLVVPRGARVTIHVVNADDDMAHGLVITPGGSSATPYLPMTTASPAFRGAAVWFLGGSTSAGMHEATMTFTASVSGDYRYVCPVPGHAQEGMVGAFVVTR
jgi:rusticyanin